MNPVRSLARDKVASPEDLGGATSNGMNEKKQLLSRLIFLGVFGLAIVGIFFISKNYSKPEETIGTADENLPPAEPGKAVLVEFSDFQCPACGAYYPLVKQLKSEFPDTLTVVYKHFPLKSIHKNADLAARASEAALTQGKFWEMHDKLFENQAEWSGSSQALSFFGGYALEIGLDKERFLGDIDNSEVYDKVNSDYQEGVRLKVSGTPTFFLNGKKLTNPRSYDEFKGLIEQALKQ